MIPSLLRRCALPVMLISAAALSSTASSAQSAGPMTMQEGRRLIAPFYDMLNMPATKDLKALSESVMAPDWRSYSGEGAFKNRDEFVGQVGGFGKLIPDLAWNIKEVLVDGNRVIVRSEASGTPAAPLFGVAPSGRGFRIMTIDIHTVQDGKLIAAYHVEDWAGAIRQISAK